MSPCSASISANFFTSDSLHHAQTEWHIPKQTTVCLRGSAHRGIMTERTDNKKPHCAIPA